MDRLEKAIAASDRHNNTGAILYIDLDDFKTLNDTRGALGAMGSGVSLSSASDLGSAA